MNDLKEFVDYVWSFYGASDALYPIEGLKRQHIYDGFYIYKNRLIKAMNDSSNTYTWSYGDSLDRERVRDIILQENIISWEV